jgi:hypothetical protein
MLRTLLVATLAWVGFSLHVQAAPTSGLSKPSMVPGIAIELVQRREGRRRDGRRFDRRDRRFGRRFDRRRGRRFDRRRGRRGPPRGYRRFGRRPSNWRRRGCIVIGPVWYCP